METKMKASLYVAGFIVAISIPASAATISGTGSPGSAVTSGTTETFDTTAAGLYTSQTFGNVTISSVGSAYTVGSDYNGQYNTSGGQSIYNDFDFLPDNFKFEFATAVGAFAFNWGAADVAWTLSAYDAANNLLESFVLAPTFGSNAGEFYGISAAGISYATLQGSGDYVFIDNFTSTTVAPVPLPAGLPLLLGALGALALVRRRRA
jgi:hypothetical protein